MPRIVLSLFALFIMFLALAAPAASEQGQWMPLETDAKLVAHMTKAGLPLMKYRGDDAARIIGYGRIAGLTDSDFAKRLGKLGELYWLRGRYSDAVTVYGQALDMRKEASGPEHPKLALGHNNLALILASLGRLEEAETHYQRALEIAGKSAGQKSDAAIIRENYANFRSGQP